MKNGVRVSPRSSGVGISPKMKIFDNVRKKLRILNKFERENSSLLVKNWVRVSLRSNMVGLSRKDENFLCFRRKSSFLKKKNFKNKNRRFV